MRFVIVTGMSGAGKSAALKFLEDIGYFCVDNLPPSLASKIAELFLSASKGGLARNVAIGADIRGGELLNELLPEIDALADDMGVTPEVVFLDAADDVLVKRYKESRRVHPLAADGGTTEGGLANERLILEKIRERADYILDTSRLLTRQLKEQINGIFVENKPFDSLSITVVSFGFKSGLPQDCDLVFDVRFLPNPFYVPELKELTGLDEGVRGYVEKGGVFAEFLTKLTDMTEFLLPRYVAEGKNRLVIGIGCTGGRHRSVAVADALCVYLRKTGRNAFSSHRDI